MGVVTSAEPVPRLGASVALIIAALLFLVARVATANLLGTVPQQWLANVGPSDCAQAWNAVLSDAGAPDTLTPPQTMAPLNIIQAIVVRCSLVDPTSLGETCSDWHTGVSVIAMTTGAVIWQQDFPGCFTGLAIRPTQAIVVATDGAINVLEPAAGTLNASGSPTGMAPTLGFVGRVEGATTDADDLYIYNATSTAVVNFSPSGSMTFGVVYQTSANAQFQTTPQLTSDEQVVFAVLSDNSLVGFPKWSVTLTDMPRSLPLLVGGVLVVDPGAAGSALQGYNISSGAMVWNVTLTQPGTSLLGFGPSQRVPSSSVAVVAAVTFTSTLVSGDVLVTFVDPASGRFVDVVIIPEAHRTADVSLIAVTSSGGPNNSIAAASQYVVGSMDSGSNFTFLPVYAPTAAVIVVPPSQLVGDPAPAALLAYGSDLVFSYPNALDVFSVPAGAFTATYASPADDQGNSTSLGAVCVVPVPLFGVDAFLMAAVGNANFGYWAALTPAATFPTTAVPPSTAAPSTTAAPPTTTHLSTTSAPPTTIAPPPPTLTTVAPNQTTMPPTTSAAPTTTAPLPTTFVVTFASGIRPDLEIFRQQLASFLNTSASNVQIIAYDSSSITFQLIGSNAGMLAAALLAAPADQLRSQLGISNLSPAPPTGAPSGSDSRSSQQVAIIVACSVAGGIILVLVGVAGFLYMRKSNPTYDSYVKMQASGTLVTGGGGGGDRGGRREPTLNDTYNEDEHLQERELRQMLSTGMRPPPTFPLPRAPQQQRSSEPNIFDSLL